EKRRLNHVRGKLYLIRGNQIAFPEFKRPALQRRLIGDRPEDEAAIWLEIVVLKKLTTAFQREISSIYEVFVESIALRVDVVDLVLVLTIDNEEHVRQRVGCVGIVGDGQRVKLSLRFNGGKRAR